MIIWEVVLVRSAVSMLVMMTPDAVFWLVDIVNGHKKEKRNDACLTKAMEQYVKPKKIEHMIG